MSTAVDDDLDQDYIDNGTQNAENYANKENQRKMRNTLPRSSKGGGKGQKRTPGQANNPNIQKKGRGIPNPTSRFGKGQSGGSGKEVAKNAAKKVAAEGAKKATRYAGRSLAAETAGLSVIAAEAAILAAEHKREALIIIIVAIVIMLLPLLFFLWLAFGLSGSSKPCTSPSNSTVTVPDSQTAKGELTTEQYMDIYGHNQAEVEANLVPITFQGKSVKVNKLVQAVFEKVDKEITQANTGYQFTSVGTYSWRPKNCPSGCSGLSTHSFGIAMDINPTTNPYTTADTHDIPPAVVSIFTQNGFEWGGDFHPAHDWMHFQYEGDPQTPGSPVASDSAGVASGAATASTSGQTGGTSTSGGCPPSGGGGTGSTSADYVAPSDDNCGGKYTFNTPIGKNFGDPGCNFNKDQLYTMIKQADPTNADVWFNKIITCESGYNPNARAGPQTGTPDAAGAWGLFQMGSANPPGSPPPAPGKNGPNDRGDVNWQVQVANATAYGQKIGDLKKYWACAR